MRMAMRTQPTGEQNLAASRDMVIDAPTEFRVRTKAYTDAAVFEDEMRRILERTWVYLAHESEVAKPGDYQTAYIGKQPVIVSRDQEGGINVMLNSCRHRGNVVCREERGNTRRFQCSYHGWVYDNRGTLVGIAERSGYADLFEENVPGLVPVPRVTVYRGSIFASRNTHIESTEYYLGAAREYVDLWADRAPDGTLRVLRPHKTRYPANWKFQAEQDTDGYHGIYVHDSAFKTRAHFYGASDREERKS